MNEDVNVDVVVEDEELHVDVENDMYACTGDMKKSTYDSNYNGIVDNAEKVNNHTVESDVPQNAVFTDTVYDDTQVKSDINNLQTNKADKSEVPDVSNFITKTVDDLVNYELKTNTGATITLSIDSSTYVMTLQLKNSAGTVLSTGTIDLPLESVVVGGSYDSTNKKVVLTLQNGNTIEFSVADLVSGLQSEINSNNKLDSDLVDDTNQTNKFVTTNEKNTWNGKQDALLTDIISSGNITVNAQSGASKDNLGIVKSGYTCIGATVYRTYGPSSGYLIITPRIDEDSVSVYNPSASQISISFDLKCIYIKN